MYRTAVVPFSTRFPPAASSAWLARRWYYTARTHRAYSVRQISPGDRRLLAEFAVQLAQTASDRDIASVRELTPMLFDHVISVDAAENALGFAAFESTSAGDRVIGVAAYAHTSTECAEFSVAVSNAYREEQVGRTLLSTLARHAKRVGVPCLVGQMFWSNRAMQVLATSLGFSLELVAGDRNQRIVRLALK